MASGNFGNTQNQQSQPQQQSSSSLFGNLNAGAPNPASNAFPGGLTMGQNQPNQSSVPGVRIDVSNLRSTTRFNDLHEDLQKEIENIDNIIERQIQLKQECDAIMPSHNEQLSNIPSDVQLLTRKANGVEEALQTDAESIMLVRKLVKSDAENAKISFKAIENLKLPAQYHQGGSGAIWNAKEANGSNENGAQDLVSFFSSTADDMKTKLDTYKNHIGQVEQHLRGVEAATMNQLQQLANGRGASGIGGPDATEQRLELMAVLREFEDGVLAVAGNVGNTRDAMQQLQLGGFADMKNGANPPGYKRKGIY